MHGRWALQSGRPLSSGRLLPMSPKHAQSVSFSPPSPGLPRPATSGSATFSPPSPGLPRPATSGSVPQLVSAVRSPEAMPLSLMPDNALQLMDQYEADEGCMEHDHAVDHVVRSSASARAARRKLQAQRRLLASRGLWRPRSSDAVIDAELGADLSPPASVGAVGATAGPSWAIGSTPSLSLWGNEAVDGEHATSSKMDAWAEDAAAAHAAAQAGHAERAARQENAKPCPLG